MNRSSSDGPIRPRWSRVAVPVFAMVMEFIGGSGSGRIAVLIALGLLLVFVIVYEFVLSKQLRFARSRWCSMCDARSRADAEACCACGRVFRSTEGTLYEPNLKIVGATKNVKPLVTVVMLSMFAVSIAIVIAVNRADRILLIFVFFLALPVYVEELTKWLLLRRLVAQVVSQQGRVCTSCRYSIDESMVKCPECGKRETAASAQRDWLATGLWLPHSRVTLAADPRVGPDGSQGHP